MSSQGVTLLFQQVKLADEVLGEILPGPVFHFLARDAGNSSLFILLHDPFVNLNDSRVTFADGSLALQS